MIALLTLAGLAFALYRLIDATKPHAPKHWRNPGVAMRVRDGRLHYRSLAARQNRAGETT